MHDLLRDIRRHDVSRVRFAIGILESESFARFDRLAAGSGCKKQAGEGNHDEIGGEGRDFRHKERRISSRIVASATAFSRFFSFFSLSETTLRNQAPNGTGFWPGLKRKCPVNTTRRRFIKLSGTGALALA